MGSVESSTLESVESLSSTLLEIERRLTSIEDVHLHHDRTICHDNTILVSGKLINCQPGVKAIVGPIIGLVSQTSARILIEVNIPTTLTFNVFHVDELTTDGRFHLSVSREILGNIPTAWTISGLLPSTRYAIYIGGLEPSEALINYVMFSTLPSETDRVHVIFESRGCVDKLTPGETNLWRTIEAEVTEGCLPKPVNTTSAAVHLVVHLGGFVSVEATLRHFGIQLLDTLVRDDVSEWAWQQLLREAETALVQLYRDAFNSPSFQKIFKRCGHIFVAGSEEAGGDTAALLGVRDVGEGITGKEEKEKAAEEAHKALLKRQREEKIQMAKYGVTISAKPADASTASADEAKDEIDAQDSDFDDEDTGRLVMGTEEFLRRERRKAEKGLLATMEVQDELRRLVLACLLRLARRVQWRYMRQLWDSDYEQLSHLELVDEDTHRELLRLKRVLWTKQEACHRIKQTLKRLEEKFGKDYNAVVQVTELHKAATEDVSDAEDAISAVAFSSNEGAVILKDTPAGGVLDLGGTVLMLIELCWGWLTPEGNVHEATHTETMLHPKLWSKLEAVTSMRRLYSSSGPNKSASDDVDNKDSAKSNDTYTQQREVETGLRTLIIASSQPLHVSSSRVAKQAEEYAPPELTFNLVVSDQFELMTITSRWQSGDLKRAVLYATGSGYGFSGTGWAYPPAHIDSEGRHTGGQEAVMEHTRLRALIVGPLTLPPGPPLSDVPLPPSHALVVLSETFRTPTEEDPVSTFSSEYVIDRKGVPGSRSFWSVKPNVPSGTAGDGATFHLAIHSDLDRENIISDGALASFSVGPLIGVVTSTSALLLLESSKTGVAKVGVIDQLTGVSYWVQRQLVERLPTRVVFDGLLPNRPYVVRLVGEEEEESGSEHLQVQAAGSFTTDSDIRYRAGALAKERRAIADARAQVDGVSASTRMEAKKGEEEVVRILMIGSLQHMPLEGGTDGAASATNGSIDLALVRRREAEANELVRAATTLLRCPWSGCGLVVHVGGGVGDLSQGVRAATAILSLAELETGDLAEQTRLVSLAEDALRRSVRLNVGASGVLKDLFMHGSHVSLTCPSAELCAAFNGASCLRELERDTSTFCLQHLLRIMERLDSEYMRALWSEDSVFTPLVVHMLHDGTVAIVGLTLRPQLARDGFSHSGLLSSAHFHELSELIKCPSVLAVVLVSPFPVVTQDPRLRMSSASLSGTKGGSAFSVDETLRLFDMFSSWGGQLVIACSGSLASYTTSVTGFRRDNLMTTSSSNSSTSAQLQQICAPDYSFRQICLGPIAIHSLDEPALDLLSVSLESPPRPKDSFPGMTYQVRHAIVKSVEAAVCGIVEFKWTPQPASAISSSETRSGSSTVSKGALSCQLLVADEVRGLCPETPEASYGMASIWEVVDTWTVGGSYGGLGASASELQSASAKADLFTLVDAVRIGLHTPEALDTLARSHLLFRDSCFGSASLSPSDSEPSLSALFHWTRDELRLLGLDYALPSPVVVRRMWTAQCAGVSGKLTADLTEEKNRLVIATLHSDLMMFEEFIVNTFIAAALVQYLASGLGLGDGW